MPASGLGGQCDDYQVTSANCAADHKPSSAVQVIRVYSLRKVPLQEEGKFELDYWCDICAIPMYELKAMNCVLVLPPGVSRLSTSSM